MKVVSNASVLVMQYKGSAPNEIQFQQGEIDHFSGLNEVVAVLGEFSAVGASWKFLP